MNDFRRMAVSLGLLTSPLAFFSDISSTSVSPGTISKIELSYTLNSTTSNGTLNLLYSYYGDYSYTEVVNIAQVLQGDAAYLGLQVVLVGIRGLTRYRSLASWALVSQERI